MSRQGLARHNPRRDGNEGDIVKAFKDRGCQVWKISGKGVCDLLIFSPLSGRTFLAEVKMPDGTFTEDQKKFWALWQGEKYIVRNANEVNAIDL